MSNLIKNLSNNALSEEHEESSSPSPGILFSGQFTNPFGYKVNRSAGTKDWVITYTMSGSGYYRTDEAEFHCSTGHVVILKPGTPHHYSTKEGTIWSFMGAHFLPEPDWYDLLLLPEEPKGILFANIKDLEARKRIITAFQRMIRDNLNFTSHHARLSLNAMEEMLLIISNSHSDVQNRKLDPLINDILQYLRHTTKEPHSIEKLARHFATSPSYLSHLFKKKTGYSIMDTLQKLRLKQAARMLEHTSMQVAQVAEEVGFKNPFHFSKQFKAFYGRCPRAYRQQTQQ